MIKINQFMLPFNQTIQVTPNNPPGTTSLTAVMMGLALSFTPIYSGKVKLQVQVSLENDTVQHGAICDMRFSTGTPPNNGDAVTGTLIGKAAKNVVQQGAKFSSNPTLIGYLSNLLVGTTYWFDLSLLQQGIGGGTATIKNIDYIITEYNA